MFSSIKIKLLLKAMCLLTALLFVVFSAGKCLAHPGGLDRNGGHHNRKTGEYHYHSGQTEGSRDTYRKPAELLISYPKIAKTEKETIGVKVVGISDGDTIKVILDGKEAKIRLYGIDSPESKQQYGQAAKDAIKQITTGRDIQIENLGQDKYGRLLAIVYADGKSVNEIMIKGGYAWVYEQYCTIAVCEEWRLYQREAKDLKRALWSDINPTPPWGWRQENK